MRRGKILAHALTGSWRHRPPPWDLPPSDLDLLGNLLRDSGTAGLVWRRLRMSHRLSERQMARYRHVVLRNMLDAVRKEQQLAQMIAFLAARGIEPVLGKGWAAARLYPDPGLRPYSDVDLYVPREHYGEAHAAVCDPQAPPCPVDLHEGFAELEDRSPKELYARSQLLSLEGVRIRIFGPEDHLRLLCLHALRHGMRRPLWLCDIAAALESRPADFDWDYFLSGDPRRTEWVLCALSASHTLLGADVHGVPVALPTLPLWVTKTVLGEWEKPYVPRAPIETTLWPPHVFLRELRRKWPNPIEATVTTRGSFDRGLRFPRQLADLILRALGALRRLRERRSA